MLDRTKKQETAPAAKPKYQHSKPKITNMTRSAVEHFATGGMGSYGNSLGEGSVWKSMGAAGRCYE